MNEYKKKTDKEAQNSIVLHMQIVIVTNILHWYTYEANCDLFGLTETTVHSIKPPLWLPPARLTSPMYHKTSLCLGWLSTLFIRRGDQTNFKPLVAGMKTQWYVEKMMT